MPSRWQDQLVVSDAQPGVTWAEGAIGTFEVARAASDLARPGWMVSLRRHARPSAGSCSRSASSTPESARERLCTQGAVDNSRARLNPRSRGWANTGSRCVTNSNQSRRSPHARHERPTGSLNVLCVATGASPPRRRSIECSTRGSRAQTGPRAWCRATAPSMDRAHRCARPASTSSRSADAGSADRRRQRRVVVPAHRRRRGGYAGRRRARPARDIHHRRRRPSCGRPQMTARDGDRAECQRALACSAWLGRALAGEARRS